MNENLQDELYQLEDKQSKEAKLPSDIRWKLEGKKSSKTFFKVPEKQNLQSQTIYILTIVRAFLNLNNTNNNNNNNNNKKL